MVAVAGRAVATVSRAAAFGEISPAATAIHSVRPIIWPYRVGCSKLASKTRLLLGCFECFDTFGNKVFHKIFFSPKSNIFNPCPA